MRRKVRIEITLTIDCNEHEMSYDDLCGAIKANTETEIDGGLYDCEANPFVTVKEYDVTVVPAI